MNGLVRFSPYKLTILAVVLVLGLAAAFVEIAASQAVAAAYLAIVAPTLVALLALLRVEQNATDVREVKNTTQESLSQIAKQHRAIAAATDRKLEELRGTVQDTAHVLRNRE